MLELLVFFNGAFINSQHKYTGHALIVTKHKQEAGISCRMTFLWLSGAVCVHV